MAATRTYDLVILGATGYTGRCAVQHIYTTLPTNIRWAVAGRSSNKLVKLVEQMEKAHPGRQHPGIEIVELNVQDLAALAQKTRAIINGVGPYHIYSTPVVEACATNGTHYFDVTGETPWYFDLLSSYNAVAKETGAILVPEVGLESLPTDVVAYMVASHLRRTYNADTAHVTSCVYRLKSGGLSGGTLYTTLSVTEDYPISQLRKTMMPYSLATTTPSPLPPTKQPLSSRLLGPFNLPPLGILTSSPTSIPNVCISHRSASLLPKIYGNSFRHEEYFHVPSYLLGIAMHLVLSTLPLILLIPPVRWIMKRWLTQPGFGPSEESNKDSILDMRALGTAVMASPDQGKPRKAVSRLTYKRDMYYMSGVLMVECAMAALLNEGKVKEQFGGGGILTGACLAETAGLVERMRAAGFEIEVDDYEG